MLPPSLESRVANVLTWVERLMRLCPIEAISMELDKFDMQAMQHPEITGTLYQQGERMGYEVREYLLEKWGRRCVYCVTPVTGHHLSGKQSLTPYGNGGMLNVLLAR